MSHPEIPARFTREPRKLTKRETDLLARLEGIAREHEDDHPEIAEEIRAEIRRFEYPKRPLSNKSREDIKTVARLRNEGKSWATIEKELGENGNSIVREMRRRYTKEVKHYQRALRMIAEFNSKVELEDGDQ